MDFRALQGETNAAAGIGHQDMLEHKLNYESTAAIPNCDACGGTSEMLQTRKGCPGMFLCDACRERPIEWVQAQEFGPGKSQASQGTEEERMCKTDTTTGVSAVREGLERPVDQRSAADSFLAESAEEVQAITP
jgi:hypothetical protein